MLVLLVQARLAMVVTFCVDYSASESDCSHLVPDMYAGSHRYCRRRIGITLKTSQPRAGSNGTKSEYKSATAADLCRYYASTFPADDLNLWSLNPSKARGSLVRLANLHERTGEGGAVLERVGPASSRVRWSTTPDWRKRIGVNFTQSYPMSTLSSQAARQPGSPGSQRESAQEQSPLR